MPDLPARFDHALDAWVLGSYEDVGAALRDARLTGVASADGVAAHLEVRAAVARALSGRQAESWRAALERSALERAAALATERPVDLLAEFAAPWGLELAITVTGACLAHAEELARLARDVFVAAALRTDAAAGAESGAAAAELARRLPSAECALNVQAFVALSQTLPHLLAGMWLELFGQPGAAARLRAEPHLLPAATEELLRLGSPARAVFRHALADLQIGQATIRRGERVVLQLATSDRDPAHYAAPDRLDLDGTTRDHHAFGAGAHACSGARLVRAATAIATGALLRATGAVELVGPVTWLDGFAIRAPASLPALLRPGSRQKS